MKGVKCQKKTTEGYLRRFVKRPRYYGKGIAINGHRRESENNSIKGEQGGSVTASYKHWVNRTKQFKLLSYPELELTDVLCLPAKIKVNYTCLYVHGAFSYCCVIDKL